MIGTRKRIERSLTLASALAPAVPQNVIRCTAAVALARLPR